MSGSSLGQHLRHSLELFLCLQKGLTTGTVNYDKRDRDKAMETDKDVAIATIALIRRELATHRDDRSIKLEMSLDRDVSESITIPTTYFRELAYNIDHIVHHLAMIRIGLKECAGYVIVPEELGLAASTIRYQQSSAQRTATAA